MNPPSATTAVPDKNPRFPPRLVLAAVVFTVGLAAWDVWTVYQDARAYSIGIGRATRLSGAAARILHLDEVLTMAALETLTSPGQRLAY